jgi:hypothetical protein
MLTGVAAGILGGLLGVLAGPWLEAQFTVARVAQMPALVASIVAVAGYRLLLHRHGAPKLERTRER